MLAEAGSATAELDILLVIAALDGLRLSVLSAAEQGDDLDWLEPAVRRLVDSLT